MVNFCTSAVHLEQTGAFMGLVQISGKIALSMCKLQVPEVWNLTKFGQIFIRMKKPNECYTSLPFFRAGVASFPKKQPQVFLIMGKPTTLPLLEYVSVYV